jgi:hypothetical protein
MPPDSITCCSWKPKTEDVSQRHRHQVQRGIVAKRIPFYNMRYDKGAEDKLFETLSGRIQEITAIFGCVPDFIVDRWVDDMLEQRKWDDTTLLTVISDQRDNPFVVKETTESLDADWEATPEILNKNDSLRELMWSW